MHKSPSGPDFQLSPGPRPTPTRSSRSPPAAVLAYPAKAPQHRRSDEPGPWRHTHGHHPLHLRLALPSRGRPLDLTYPPGRRPHPRSQPGSCPFSARVPRPQLAHPGPAALRLAALLTQLRSVARAGRRRRRHLTPRAAARVSGRPRDPRLGLWHAGSCSPTTGTGGLGGRGQPAGWAGHPPAPGGGLCGPRSLGEGEGEGGGYLPGILGKKQ